MSEEIAAFPEFTAITLANKHLYLRRMFQYPPISDLSLATLMIWWSRGTHTFPVSLLNDNLVIHYDGPQSERGMSLIGYNRIEESLETILDECKHRNEPERVIHVPEFVVAEIGASNLLRIEEEMGYREYLVPVSHLYPLEGIRHERHRKIKRFYDQIAGAGLTIDIVSPVSSGNRQ
ncbi:MAG: hypothetical protein HQM12_22640 [SAR324 cluster bacterium]|nr:hypothetical protein [SAR324 cluster bacterium]